mgnify:CR=1 FL=1
MASKKIMTETLAFLKETYHFEGEPVLDEWALLLDSMTNKQVETARVYLREHHQTSFAPAMALFKQWGTAADDRAARNQQWWKTHDPVLVTDSEGRPHALCEAGEDGIARPILEPQRETHPRALQPPGFRVGQDGARRALEEIARRAQLAGAVARGLDALHALKREHAQGQREPGEEG